MTDKTSTSVRLITGTHLLIQVLQREPCLLELPPVEADPQGTAVLAPISGTIDLHKHVVVGEVEGVACDGRQSGEPLWPVVRMLGHVKMRVSV